MFTKKKPIDKVRAMSLTPWEKYGDGSVLCLMEYDVRKIRRMKKDDIVDILFEKTLQLYPFAIVSRHAEISKELGVAYVRMRVPLHPGMHTDPIQ